MYFRRRARAGSQVAELTAADGAAYDNYGFSVGVSNSTVAVGAYGNTRPDGTNSGAVYVYDLAGKTWNLQAELTPSDSENLGFSLAINGATLVSGALGSTVNGSAVAGAVYVFKFDGSNWTQQARLTAADSAPYGRFGYSVALKNHRVLVGGFGLLPFGGVGPGMAYLFTQSRSVWTQRKELTPPSGDPYNEFGWSVALGITGLYVGAPQQEVQPGEFPGAVYLYPQD